MGVRDWKGGFTRTEVKDSISISRSSPVKVQCGPVVCYTIAYGWDSGHHDNSKQIRHFLTSLCWHDQFYTILSKDMYIGAGVQTN